ncbi:MAG: T9SS type A sorting domain-containing protein [Flavobacteriales bacterium]|nr:T9SS type A sorting domain-containing protein [Flavobacteriales bacterium]
MDVGESVGLARFFRIDSFPLILEPVELLGQAEPALGLYQITPAFLHNHQPGDEVQTHHYAFHYTGPPTQNYNFIRKVRILSREDTPVSVIYEVETSTFNMGSSSENVQTGTISYSKTGVIATIPFSRFYGTQPILRMEDYCGLPLLTYSTFLNMGLAYCPEENCWGPYDTNGPPPMGTTVLVEGLGTYDEWTSVISPTGYSISSSLVYFMKNGIPCGTEVLLGLDDLTRAASSIQLAPNPAQDRVQVLGTDDAINAELFSASGKRLFERPLSLDRWIDLGGLSRGLYLMRVTTRSGAIRSGRLMIDR